MTSASSAWGVAANPWRPSSSTIRALSESFIWQPKVWTNTLRAAAAATGAAPRARASMPCSETETGSDMSERGT